MVSGDLAGPTSIPVSHGVKDKGGLGASGGEIILEACH